MRREIESKADIEELIADLYAGLMVDAEIGHFFTKVVQLDLEHHLPKIVGFWDSVLFLNEGYDGDPIAVHIKLDRLSRMEPAAFERWLWHFDQAVDRKFEGEIAERAKQRARSIATIMQIKLLKNHPE